MSEFEQAIIGILWVAGVKARRRWSSQFSSHVGKHLQLLPAWQADSFHRFEVFDSCVAAIAEPLGYPRDREVGR